MPPAPHDASPAPHDAPRPPRAPIVELFLLAVPTILQMVAYTVEQFCDTLMLSRVSDLHATAAGNAGGVVFAVISFGFGVLMLINALVSQNFGAKKPLECGPVLWQGVWFSLAYALLVLPLIPAAPWVFGVLRHGPDLVALEVPYFNVSMSLIALKLVAVALGQFMLAVNRPQVVFWAAAAGMVLNVLVNWLLIYGNLGCPALGVAGAAWGTNAAMLSELVIVAAVAFRPLMRQTYRLTAWQIDRARLTELLRYGVPSGVQMTGDVVAWVLFFTAVVPFYGLAAMAANMYMLQYMKLSFMPAFGLSTAVTALVARYVGAGRPDLSARRAHLGFAVTAGYMLSCGVVFFTLRRPLIGLFTDDPTVVGIGASLMVVAAIFQFFDSMFILYTGALRGVKDTFVPAVVQIALCWTLVLAGGFACAIYLPQLGLIAPWLLACVYGMALGLFLLVRFRAGRWKTIPVG